MIQKLTFDRSAVQFVMDALGLKRPTCHLCKQRMTAKTYAGTVLGIGHVCNDVDCVIGLAEIILERLRKAQPSSVAAKGGGK